MTMSLLRRGPAWLPAAATCVLVLVGAVLLASGYQPADAAPGQDPGLAWYPDAGKFAGYGLALLHGNLAGVYADPWNQAGPLQVLLAALGHQAALTLGYPAGPFALHTLIGALLLGLAAGLTRALAAPAHVDNAVKRWLPAVTVVLTAAAIPTTVLSLNGHWLQLPVLVAWIVVGVLTARGRWLPAGLLLGVTVLAEPWGILGTALLLVGTRVRPTVRVRALGTAALVAAAGWLPFAVQPGFAFTEHVWRIYPGSVWAVVLDPASGFPWTARLAQAAVVLAAALIVWWRLTLRLPPVWTSWAMTVTVVLVRDALEVRWLNYYLSAGQVLLIAGAVVLTAAWSWRALPVGLAALLATRAITQPVLTDSPGSPFAVYCTGVLIVVAVALLPGRRWPTDRSG